MGGREGSPTHSLCGGHLLYFVKRRDSVEIVAFPEGGELHGRKRGGFGFKKRAALTGRGIIVAKGRVRGGRRNWGQRAKGCLILGTALFRPGTKWGREQWEKGTDMS